MIRPTLATVAVSLVATAGCGAGRHSAPLAWQVPPLAYRLHDLPNDRVVLARVRNRSATTLHLDASRAVVRDAHGRLLSSSVRYIGSFAHGLYGAFQKPSYLPAQELSRLGLVIDLPAGRSTPLTVAWRLIPGAAAPQSVDYGAGRLELPRAVANAAP